VAPRYGGAKRAAKFGSLPGLIRYGFIDNPYCCDRRLSPQRFHGRVITLVNEQTASAGEMVAAFAEENNLAAILVTKTPDAPERRAFKADLGTSLAFRSRIPEMAGQANRRTRRDASIPVAQPPLQLLAAKTLRCKGLGLAATLRSQIWMHSGACNLVIKKSVRYETPVVYSESA